MSHVPICCACYDEMELKPPRRVTRPGEPMQFGELEYCMFCNAQTWAGLFVDEDTAEPERTIYGRGKLHEAEGVQGLQRVDPLGTHEAARALNAHGRQPGDGREERPLLLEAGERAEGGDLPGRCGAPREAPLCLPLGHVPGPSEEE